MGLNVERIEKVPVAQKVLIVGGVILIIYVAFYFLWVQGKYNIIKDKSETLEKKRREVAQGEAVKAEIQRYMDIQAKLENQLKEAEKKLPKQAEIPELLEKISDLARGNFLVFSTFHPDLKPQPGGGGVYQQIFIEVDFWGDYHRIATFLDQISKLERIINVEKLTLDPTGGYNNLKASVKLVTYMFGG